MPTNTKQQTVVLYPFPGVGHVVPMAQLAKVFLRHGYDVTIVLIQPPPGLADFGASVIDRIAASNPAISFHVFPPISGTDLAGSGKNPLLLLLQLMRRYNDALETFLRSMPPCCLHSLVTTMFTAHAVDVGTKLPVPVYTFFAPAAATLAVVAQLPALLAGRTTPLRELETPLEFLGVPPLPASLLMPEVLEHPDEELCHTIVNVWKRVMEADGVPVNTFESLEARPVQALMDPRRCVPGRALPPVYCVGPLVCESADLLADQERHQCLAWLDLQPECSVVFLCFGSRGSLSAEPLREIAVGLEKSGQRFLWVLPTVAGTDDDSKNLDAVLPDGFLERTKDRGLVVKSWAPQVDVLRHQATGAFVTHCGWNSTLETITAGVPTLCWPLYAEQMLNKVLATVDMGIGD
ncbi:UDP-glycosyltransferase 88F4 [Dichanthelium oligosanthes]|uniref:Glycosyltransferase n=1 Tax=Dichanthelium oligosanthes TaxID=888268 RepID=A0A1E5VQ33_9POAL|nr:UDP-glycosyltransferase 88F4 [Dichanthelium oligosanthes]